MRFSLALDLKTRPTAPAGKDAQMRNAYVDLDPKKRKLFARKRAGVGLIGAVGAGVSQLEACWNGLLSTVGDTLYSLLIAASESRFTFTGTNSYIKQGAYASGLFVQASYTTVPVLESSSNGVSWTTLAGPSLGVGYLWYGVSYDTVNSTWVLAASNGGTGNKIFKSVDLASWSSFVPSVPGGAGAFLGISCINGVYTAVYLKFGGLWEIISSLDFGVTWTDQVGNGFSFAALFTGNGTSYAILNDNGTGLGTLYGSTNGVSFSALYTAGAPLQSGSCYNNVIAILDGGPSLSVSINAGGSFTSVALPAEIQPGVIANAIVGVTAGFLYVAAYDDTGFLTYLAVSTDLGSNWIVYSDAAVSVSAFSSFLFGAATTVFCDNSSQSWIVAGGGSGYIVNATNLGGLNPITAGLQLLSESTGASVSTQALLMKTSQQAWLYTK